MGSIWNPKADKLTCELRSTKSSAGSLTFIEALVHVPIVDKNVLVRRTVSSDFYAKAKDKIVNGMIEEALCSSLIERYEVSGH